MTTHTLRLSLATALLAMLAGCDTAQPTTYRIPKEERVVTMPSAAKQPAKQAAKQAPATEGNMRVLPGMKEAAKQSGGVHFTAPEGWEEFPATGIRKANLMVSDGNGSAELTVLVFPGDVGGRLANINRWRGQIGLGEATPEDLPSFTESCTIAGHRGLYVRLEGAEQSILGGLLPFHGNTWFFKLHGASTTVLANEPEMMMFLSTVALEDHNH